MGWKTDWLYARVFDLARDTWKKGLQEAELASQYRILATLATPPECMVIRQWGNANLTSAHCDYPVLREWVYDGTELQQRIPSVPPAVPYKRQSRDTSNKMFFAQAHANFYIAPDRKAVVFTYVFGPRFGAGFVYAVTGQGRRGRLGFASDARGWIS